MNQSPIPAAPTADAATSTERLDHALTIAAIPYSAFPDDAARAQLRAWALEGRDVYAYQHATLTEWIDANPTAEPPSAWVLWIGSTRAWEDQRWEPNEWARVWRAAGCPTGQESTTTPAPTRSEASA